VGETVTSSERAPHFTGIVEDLGPADFPSALIRLLEPSPGLVHVFPIQMDQVYLSIRFFLYGHEVEVGVYVDLRYWFLHVEKTFGGDIGHGNVHSDHSNHHESQGFG